MSTMKSMPCLHKGTPLLAMSATPAATPSASTNPAAPPAAPAGNTDTTESKNTETKPTEAAGSTSTPAPATAGTTGDLNDPKTSYENAKKELIQAIQRKKQLEKQLVSIICSSIFTKRANLVNGN
jgi:hypothetical protein